MDKISSNVVRVSVDLESLNVDRSYQRDVRKHHRIIAKNFDPQLCDDLFICRRKNGGLWIIDGQQRKEALTANGYKKWRARIVESHGVEWEARMFLIANGGSGSKKMPTCFEMFKARLTAKEEVAVTVMQVAKRVGLNPLSKERKFPNISCTSVLCEMAKTGGGELLERGLRLLLRTWPQSDDALKDIVVWACCRIVINNPQLDDERFFRNLSKVPALKIIQDGRANLGGRIYGAYKSMVELYNKGIRIDSHKLNFETAAKALEEQRQHQEVV